MSIEIPVVFHNESNYDSHFIMKELANEFKGKFECLGENINTKKTFSVPIEKKLKKTLVKMVMAILQLFYKMKLIDSARFLASTLSNIADILAEGIHEI